MYRKFLEEMSGSCKQEDKTDVPQDIRDNWEREQNELKKKMVLHDSPEIKHVVSSFHSENPVEFYIGGVDISFVKGDNVNACAAFVVLNFPDLEVVYEDCQMVKLTAPYIPGFLAFREAYILKDMFEKLKATQPKMVPQVVMVDGNGILHPRGFGLACHLGVLIDVPCIGVAKNLFQVDGLEKNEDHMEKIIQLTNGGDTFPLVGTSGKMLGKALRSCDSTVNPIYISTGHLITLDTAVELVCRCCKHRVPEPTRQADMRSREYLRVNFGTDGDQQSKQPKKKERTKTKETQHTQNDCKQIDNLEEFFYGSCAMFDEDSS